MPADGERRHSYRRPPEISRSTRTTCRGRRDDHIYTARLLTSGQVTDTYLLALAVHRGARLATLDRRLATSAVKGGQAALHVISDQAWG